MPTVTMSARQCGKSFTHRQAVEISLLNALFDSRAPMSMADLKAAIRCTPRDLWAALRNQHQLGNIRRDQPFTLTASAHIAIAAGRLAGAMAVAA